MKSKQGLLFKRCTKCKEFKDISQFSRNSESSDGYRWHCKECIRKYYYPSWRKRKRQRVGNRRRDVVPLRKVVERYKRVTGYTNEQIAMQCEVNTSYIAQLLADKYKVSTEKHIEKILIGLDKEYLFRELYPMEGE